MRCAKEEEEGAVLTWWILCDLRYSLDGQDKAYTRMTVQIPYPWSD
jgi:hypothetical protein